MRKVKTVLMAAVVAASTLMVSATPRPAAAETAAASVVAMLADGWYPVYGPDGKFVGWVYLQNDSIVDSAPAT